MQGQCTVHFRFEVLSTQPGVSTAANNERHKGSLATVEGIVSSVHEKPKLSSNFKILGWPGAVPVNSPQGHVYERLERHSAHSSIAIRR